MNLDRRAAGRLAGAAALVVVLGAILGPAVLTTHPTESPGASLVAVNPSASAGQSSAPAGSPEPWADLEVPPFEPIAEFAPSDPNRAAVGTKSSFTLRSLTSTPAVELAQGLHTDPPIAFRIEQGATADVAVAHPKTELSEGVRYRVRLDAPDGALAGAWSFKTVAPLHVVEMLPGDHAVGVPLNTGIEITFDQDGTRDLGSHFSINPAALGRFEQHDRTWAFIPNQPLAPDTIYTVSVSAGVGQADSTSTLEHGVTFRFETASAVHSKPRIQFGRSMFESRPGERPTIPLRPVNDEDGEEIAIPDSITVDIHQLPSFGAVVDAASALAGPDSWAHNAPTTIVDTSRLTRVAHVDGNVLRSEASPFLRLPFQPAAGAYVLTIVQSGGPEQLLLQVTDLAAYALAGEQDTVVWLNDLATGGVVAGADVSITRGVALGSTSSTGVMRAPTPAVLRPAATGDEEPLPSFLTIRAADGRQLLVPLGLRPATWGDEGTYWNDGSDATKWWLLLQTDRYGYRRTDAINVYGMIRARSDRHVPAQVELRLRPSDGPPEVAIRRLFVDPTRRGVFTATFHIDDLPFGSYLIDLYAGSKRVSSTWIDVADIRKPAFKIEVATDRHVYVVGQQVKAAAQATFYDGTPVPGIDLRFSAFENATGSTTGALGEASATLRTAFEDEVEGWLEGEVGVLPTHPEEGQIGGSTQVYVLPSRVWLSGDGTVSGAKLAVTGRLTMADIKGMEAKAAAGRPLEYDVDGPGRPIASGTIRAEVIQSVAKRRQVGTTYDFIEKKVVPSYEYDYSDVSLGTWTVTSATDGAFHLSVPVPVATDEYRIRLQAADADGRRFISTVYARTPFTSGTSAPAYLETQGGCGYRPELKLALNAPFSLTMHTGTGATAAGGRFLFLVSQLGSMKTTVQDAATFSSAIRDADLPGFTVRAVWLDGGRFAVSDVSAVVNPDDKRLTIRLAPDRPSYRPGGTATVAITTTGPNGDPVAADVVVTGVDEKLYTQGLASDIDPAPQLMSSTNAGFLRAYASHFLPPFDEGGCGGAGGGGGREDFEDALTFQRVTTGADGRGSAQFRLPDDLTSWHITATGIDARLDSGVAHTLLPVGLPFFVDAILAPEYLVGEQPVLRVRAFGGALSPGDPVRFTIEAPTLGLAPTTIRGTAFTASEVPLPALVAGDHRIRIEGDAKVGTRTYSDTLIRTIHVSGTRLSGLVTSYDALDASFAPHGGPGLTTFAITDAGRGRLVSLLQDLAWDRSGRFDKLAASELARQVLIDEFGFSTTDLPRTGFDPLRYQQGGITLLSYSSTDLFLSAKAALAAPDLVEREGLRDAFNEWLANEAATEERKIVALAGLAGLGDDVLARLRASNVPGLTVRERLWLALGLAAGGDEPAAREIERDLLETAGQRLGPWVRLAVGDNPRDSAEASGLLLMLAGRLGDPLAHDVSQYLRDVEVRDLVFPLEQIAYVRGLLERLPREKARFAWTIAGERHEVELERGGGYRLILTSDQRASFTLERLDGQLAVVTTWTSPDAQLPTSPSLAITRTVTPADNAPDDRLVHVTIVVSFGPQATSGCYRLTDRAPSGLTPVVETAGWPSDEEDAPSKANWPYSTVGQEVSWCASPSDLSHVYVYSARVVSPGTYRWEPAMLQFEVEPSVGTATAAATYTIR